MKVKKRKIYFFSALFVALSTATLLITGSSLLTLALDHNQTIPFGTLITWAGMIAFPLSIYWGIKEFRRPTSNFNIVFARLLEITIIMGIFWVPISYLLAGNLSFTFSEKESFQGGQVAMRLFWGLSYGIVIGVILNISAYWISLLIKKGKTVSN